MLQQQCIMTIMSQALIRFPCGKHSILGDKIRVQCKKKNWNHYPKSDDVTKELIQRASIWCNALTMNQQRLQSTYFYSRKIYSFLACYLKKKVSKIVLKVLINS